MKLNLKCVLLTTMFIVPCYIDATCDPFIAQIDPRPDRITFVATWRDNDGCLPTQTDERVNWQKNIDGSWVDMFESTSSNNDGSAKDRGDNYDIFERSSGSMGARAHTMYVTEPEPCDSGSWRIFVFKNGSEHADSDSTLNILGSIETGDIKIELSDTNPVLAGNPITLTCRVDSAKPRANVTWKFNDSDSEPGTSLDEQIACGGDVWNIRNVKQKDFTQIGSVDIQCVCQQGGSKVNSNITQRDVYAPPHIIEDISSEPLHPKANETFTLNCASSGTYVSLSWFLNGTINLDEGSEYFKKPVITTETRPGLDYGQTVVKISAIESIAYENPSAETVSQQSGTFTCKATVLSQTVSKERIIQLGIRVEDLGGLSDGAIAGICIGVIALIAGILALLYFLYKKKQHQKADEEVIAYAESGNTGGANNDVKAANGAAAGANTVTTPPVYAEVDKNRKKQNANEPAGAVYSQVNKPDRPLPHLKSKHGSTNTGPVYSEVNKPKPGRLTPIENQHYDNAGHRNEHAGIHYADVDFLRQGNGANQSHGTKNPSYEPTEYAKIDHRKSAGVVV